MKIKKITKTKILIFILIVLIFITIGVSISIAWFTKEKLDENFDLNFANVDINLSAVETGPLKFEIFNNLGEKQTKLMPGDTINFPVRITNVGNVSCYYLVNLYSSELKVNNDYYFNGLSEISTSENKNLGELNAEEFHLLNLTNIVDTNLTSQGNKVNFVCTAYAIQTKNLTKEEAYLELINLKNSDNIN